MAVLLAAGTLWKEHRRWNETQAEHIERSLNTTDDFFTEAERALHRATAEWVKERAEDTRR